MRAEHPLTPHFSPCRAGDHEDRDPPQVRTHGACGSTLSWCRCTQRAAGWVSKVPTREAFGALGAPKESGTTASPAAHPGPGRCPVTLDRCFAPACLRVC